jgi:hypothetical protein
MNRKANQLPPANPASLSRPRWKTKLGLVPSKLLWCAGGASLAVASALIVYAMRNDSGHTGFEPWLLSLPFVSAFLLGAAGLITRSARRPALFASVAALAGLALLFYFDYCNVLLQYDRWIERGMP